MHLFDRQRPPSEPLVCTMDKYWYRTFFEGVALDCWRKCLSPEQTRAEVEFLLTELRCPAPASVLDVPCGHGRHSIELAGRGLKVTGVDLAEAEIQEASVRASSSGRSATWLCADMTELDFHAEFDGAFCFGNSFGYLDHSDTQRFLAGIARALKPSGRFVIQSGMTAESILPNFKEREGYRVGDLDFTVSNEYLTATSRMQTECTFVREGKTEKKSFLHAVYTSAEVQRMLAAVGLVTLALYSSVKREPYRLGSELLYLVAERRA